MRPQNLKLAFSTGHRLIQWWWPAGVKMAMDIKIPEKITVALYERIPSTYLKISQTISRLSTRRQPIAWKISKGTYYIYAFKDNNKT